jgi:hypothetical protein
MTIWERLIAMLCEVRRLQVIASKLAGILLRTIVIMFAALYAVSAGAQVNVTMQQNDIGRTGLNATETILTKANVNVNEFGLLFSQSVVGPIRGQPLYISGLTINGAKHNVVIVAGLKGNVYAFDADSNQGANASPLWGINLLDAAHGTAAGETTYGSQGTTSTPVIDRPGGTVYVISTSTAGGAPILRLHAISLTTGAEKFGGPATITASVPGTGVDAVNGIITLTPSEQNQRAALLLLNGIVYFGFGSYIEGKESVWHGWILGYNSTTLAQTSVFCTTPNGTRGGVWMSGNGLAADQLDPTNHPFGRMFVPIGNGDFTATPPYSNDMDYGDSVINLDLSNGVMTVLDDFTPYKQAMLYSADQDQGSGGLLILPTQAKGSYPNLLVQAGKDGTLYLIDRDNLGGYSQSTDNVVQSIPLAVGNSGVWSSPAYWNNNVYYWGTYDNLKQFPLVNGKLSTTPIVSSEQAQFPASTPVVSANGTTQGIVWTINSDNALNGGASVLEAHDASNVATTLYSSTMNPGRDTAGGGVYFAVPTVANGKVYVGTANQLNVYGLLGGGGGSSPTPTISPGSESFVGSVGATLSDSASNASIYYTTDGSPATISSTLYGSPIQVASTETINAVALAPGSTVSNQASATYTLSHTASPTFSPAALAYSSPQSVAISDATPGATIHFTTDGSKPSLASPVYTSPIYVGASETIKALAAASGYSNSGIETAPYTISSAALIQVDYPSGFSSASGLDLVGSASITSKTLQLSIANSAIQANAAWFATPVNVQAFTTDFYIQETAAAADGFTFTLQNSSAGVNAVGSGSGGLGYQGIGSSVAIKFDFFNNAGEGIDSTGFYTNGAAPTFPAVDMTSSAVNLNGPDMLHAHITYDGTTLTLTLIDTVTGATFTYSAAINIPTIVGGNTAYAGFTAGTHSPGATQQILNWTYASSYSVPPQAATPAFSPVGGTYGSQQSVTIGDSTSGAVIYYTTDGTPPTTSSTVYSGAAISVNANETLEAIAIASGYSQSAVAKAIYRIQTATPTLSPVGGTYSNAQSVTISDTTSGAVIYYTTDGTPPTTSATVYSAAISVNANETLEAIAMAPGYLISAVAKAIYQIQTATPTLFPLGGTYSSAQSVTISDTTSGAVIYYTTDGTTPTTSSSVYSNPVSVSANETVQAIAVVNGNALSAVGKAVYKIQAATPTFNPGAGTYTSAQTVAINDTTSGAVIHYTTDGTTPTTSSAVYSSSITVSANETVKALVVASGYANSFVATAVYKIK